MTVSSMARPKALRAGCVPAAHEDDHVHEQGRSITTIIIIIIMKCIMMMMM